MTLSVLALVAGVASLTFTVSVGQDTSYDTKYNHLDIERILNNKRLVTYYGQCLMGDGPCTPQGTEFKRILPEALRTNCARCTEKQKSTANYAILRLKKEYPKIWQQLQAKWDPKGEYVSSFVNTLETTSSNPSDEINLVSRFGDDAPAPGDNEIATGSESAPATVPLPRPSSREIQTSSTTTTTTTATATRRTPSTSWSTTRIIGETNYRTTLRPNRFNILLPRPQDIGKLTANWIGSIGDIGTKVIRTGARIADMVLSGVHAGVQATIGKGLQ